MAEVSYSFNLSDARESDLKFLFELYCDVRGPETSAWGWPAAQSEAFLRMQFEAQQRSYHAVYPKARNEIVSIDGVPAGQRLVAYSPSEMRLVDISLLAAYRNRGIGADLIQQLIDECQGNGLILRLQVLQGNPAIRLYQRNGFRETGGDPMYIQMAWLPEKAKMD